MNIIDLWCNIVNEVTSRRILLNYIYIFNDIRTFHIKRKLFREIILSTIQAFKAEAAGQPQLPVPLLIAIPRPHFQTEQVDVFNNFRPKKWDDQLKIDKCIIACHRGTWSLEIDTKRMSIIRIIHAFHKFFDRHFIISVSR